jgi:replicative DNA helicase
MTTIRYNLDAERAVLGGVLVHAQALALAKPLLPSGREFHDSGHGAMWDAILGLAASGATIDEVTIAGAMTRAAKSLVDITQLRFYAAKRWEHVEGHARIVADLAAARRIESAAERVGLKAKDPSTSVLELSSFATSEINAAAQRRSVVEPVSIGACADAFLDGIVSAAEKGRSMMGAPTGLSRLDHALCGLRPGQLVILAARPAMGKSAMAAKFARAVAETGKTALFFSLEMTRAELTERIVCEEAMLDANEVRRDTTNAYLAALTAATAKVWSLPLYIDDDPRVTAADIRARALAMHAKSPLGVIVVDYLTKVRPNPAAKNRSRENEVSECAQELKSIAKELGVPLVALAQLNRDCEDQADKRPMMSHLRESGQIEQEADAVLFLYRDEYYRKGDSDSPGIVEIIIAKCRGGTPGTVEARFIPHLTRFENLEVHDVEAIRAANARPTANASRFRRPA